MMSPLREAHDENHTGQESGGERLEILLGLWSVLLKKEKQTRLSLRLPAPCALCSCADIFDLGTNRWVESSFQLRSLWFAIHGSLWRQR